MTPIEAAALLGVASDASGPDVQRAFVRLARRVHPDLLPDATEAQRRDAAERFDALVQARGVLLTVGSPAGERPRASPAGPGAPRFAEPVAPRYRQESRGLGDSLVVLVLLAFLLVALVTVDHALRTHALEPAGTGVPSTTAAP